MNKIILIAIFFFLPMIASAASITYQLTNVVFDDGATASGVFTWTQGVASDISITTTASPNRNYSVTYTDQFSPGVIGVNFGLSLVSSASYWAISFEPTGPSDGTLYLTSTNNRPPFIYQSYYELGAAQTSKRYVVSGYIAPVPIPSAAYLLFSSLGAIVFGRRFKNC